MKTNSFKMKANSWFVLVLTVYSILDMFLLRYYQYDMSPDGVSYISIAQKYLRGNFTDAINGYWGPLISWLLLPFLLVGLTPLFAMKLLSLVVGLLTIIGVRSLSYRFEMDEGIRSIVLFSLIPIILYFSLLRTTPDLLLACILVYYLNILFNADYPDKVRNGALCGTLGAAAYLCKAYAFTFFVLHFLLFNVLHYFRSTPKENKKSVLLNLFLGLAIFFIVSGVWVYLISNKYNEITIGTAGAYNYALAGPQSQGHPFLSQGFFKPPNETAISVWEDPSFLIPKLKSWGPMQSWIYFKYQSKLICEHINKVILKYPYFTFLSITIILVYIVFCIAPFNKTILQNDALYPLITLMLYSIGYIPFKIDGRYLLIICILLILMGGSLLSKLFRNDFFNDVRKQIVLVFFVLFFVAAPSINLVKAIDYGKDTYSLSVVLDRKHNIQGNIASNHNWKKTLRLSFYLNSKYYGMPREGVSREDLEREVRENNIDYFFVWVSDLFGENSSGVWGECDDNLQFLRNYREETDGEIPGLRIYNLRENE